jgi:hypothetical protein
MIPIYLYTTYLLENVHPSYYILTYKVENDSRVHGADGTGQSSTPWNPISVPRTDHSNSLTQPHILCQEPAGCWILRSYRK